MALTFLIGAAGRGDRIHRPAGREALGLLVHRRCRPLPRPPRVHDPDGDEVTFQGAIDPHTPIAQGWLRASHRKLDPELSRPYRPYHTHDEIAAADAGRAGRARRRDLADVHRRARRATASAFTVRGKDYEWDGDTTGAKLSNFKNELKGCGPFLHDDPSDRPAEVYGGTTTLHLGPDRPAYVLTPIIPPA